jgi:hypothetical protein
MLSPVLEIPQLFSQEQARAESGQISPTQSYWNSLSGQCMVLRVGLTNLDQKMNTLEIRRLSEPMEFLGVPARDPAHDEDSELPILKTLERICPTTAQQYGSTRVALEKNVPEVFSEYLQLETNFLHSYRLQMGRDSEKQSAGNPAARGTCEIFS